MTANTATVREIPFHYEEIGDGAPVFLVHGLGVEHRVMTRTWEPLFADRPGWRRIYPDMPGHGRTPGAAWLDSDDAMLDLLESFVDAVAPGERIVLVGQSWGAYLLHALATRRPAAVDGLAMLVPVVRADRSQRDVPPSQSVVGDEAALAAIQPGEELWTQIYTVQTMEMLEAFRSGGDLLPPDETFLENLEPRYALSFEADLSTPIDAPTLVVTGRQDAIVGYRDAWPLLDHLPRATFAVLDRAGHALEDEQSDLLRALANEWLRRVEEHTAKRERR